MSVSPCRDSSRHDLPRGSPRVAKSGDAARTSACATSDRLVVGPVIARLTGVAFVRFERFRVNRDVDFRHHLFHGFLHPVR